MEEDGEIVEEPTVIEIDSSSDSRKASIDNDKDRKKSKKNRRSRSRDRSRSNRFVNGDTFNTWLLKDYVFNWMSHPTHVTIHAHFN